MTWLRRLFSKRKPIEVRLTAASPIHWLCEIRYCGCTVARTNTFENPSEALKAGEWFMGVVKGRRWYFCVDPSIQKHWYAAAGLPVPETPVG